MGKRSVASLREIGKPLDGAASGDQPVVNGAGGVGGKPNGGDGNKPEPASGPGATVDLADLGTGGDGGDGGTDRPRRKYTKRAGATKAETAELDLTAFIAENLFAAHAFLAGLSGKDIFAIEKTEADDVGRAIQGVAKHYDIPGVNQKTVDWIRLARTLGMVYGTRLFAARAARPKPSPVAAKPGATVMQEANGSAREAPAGMAWNSPGPGLPDVLMPIGG